MFKTFSLLKRGRDSAAFCVCVFVFALPFDYFVVRVCFDDFNFARAGERFYKVDVWLTHGQNIFSVACVQVHLLNYSPEDDPKDDFRAGSAFLPSLGRPWEGLGLLGSLKSKKPTCLHKRVRPLCSPIWFDNMKSCLKIEAVSFKSTRSVFYRD